MTTTISIKKKNIVNIGLLLIFVLMLVFYFANFSKQANKNVAGIVSSNVTIENSKQFITITAKNGYFPNQIEAKANIPTLIRMETKNNYGCERALTIPKYQIVKELPATGSTEIEIEAQASGTSLVGSCSMGMYSFVINFN